MAGFYPDVPSWRMAWDRDGTQVFLNNNQLASGPMRSMNSENGSNSSGDGGASYTFIFPELRDIDGYFALAGGFQFSGLTIDTSVDTTNGIDGNWANLRTSYIPSGGYRTAINTCSVLAIRAIRFSMSAGIGPWLGPVHLFGEISPNQNPNRLVLWHPTLDQRITPAYFDWGNVPRSSSADKTFRVKNLSAAQTANSIRVAQEILTDTVPSVVGQHTLSLDNVTYLAQVNIGNLIPGAISTQVLTLRRVTPVNAVLSLWAHRIFAEAGTWT